MSEFGFLLVLVVLVFLWFALVRPQRRQQQAQREMWAELQVGDDIVTAGGVYGEITGFQGDDVLVRIAPQLEVRVARRAIAGVFPPEEPAVEDSAEDAESYPEPR